MEAAAEQGVDIILTDGDPFALPGFVPLGGFKPGGLADGGIPIVGAHRYPPPVPGAGLGGNGQRAIN